jgi:predicted nucleic acid-binding protein
MNSIIVLDARPLLQICHPRKWQGISDWSAEAVASGWRIVVPEITDYEVRRLLLKRGATRQLKELNGNVEDLYYAPLTTALMREAAQVWAEAENSGHRFGHPKTLNADAILVAQTQAMGEDVTVITKNVRHLAPFVEAVWWTHFAP